MAVTDEVIDMVRLLRGRVVALTDEQVIALTGAWVDSWSELEPEFQDALANLLSDAEDTIPARVVARDQRVTQALQQAKQQLDSLSSTTEVTVTNDVGTVVLDAAHTRYETLLAQLPDGQAHAQLNRLNQVALDAIVARTTQQIHSATLPLSDDAIRAMRAELVRGITVGANPNETARRILRRTEGQFFGGLTRAARIARTETIDAFRSADYATAQTNRAVTTEWEWLATLDARSCGACISMHGQRFPNEVPGPEGHHNCRCTRIQVTKSWEDLGFTGIEDIGLDLVAQRDEWFDNLTDDTQERILGPGKYELWQQGKIGWNDLAKKVNNPGWRDSYIETPLKALL